MNYRPSSIATALLWYPFNTAKFMPIAHSFKLKSLATIWSFIRSFSSRLICNPYLPPNPKNGLLNSRNINNGELSGVAALMKNYLIFTLIRWASMSKYNTQIDKHLLAHHQWYLVIVSHKDSGNLVSTDPSW